VYLLTGQNYQRDGSGEEKILKTQSEKNIDMFMVI
jgi:hypothetical protein